MNPGLVFVLGVLVAGVALGVGWLGSKLVIWWFYRHTIEPGDELLELRRTRRYPARDYTRPGRRVEDYARRELEALQELELEELNGNGETDDPK